MRRLVGLLLLTTGCISAHRTSQRDAKRAPDQAVFEAWLLDEELEPTYAEFLGVLSLEGHHDVVPPWQLLRQGTDWAKVGHPPFAMPPAEQWESIFPTLVFLEEVLIPQIGPVEVVSGYRTEDFNQAAGGSSGSRHLHFQAVDLVPMERQSRDQLHQELEDIYDIHGDAHSLGLGLYQNTRFHIDTWKKRRW